MGAASSATLLSPLREEILRHLDPPDSASGLAKKFGLTRQKMNYHLREMERQGLVELVEERRKGNCTERLVRATKRSYLLRPDVLNLTRVSPSDIRDRLSSTYLLALALQTMSEVAEMRDQAARVNKRLATLALQTEIRFASPGQRQAFTAELADALATLIAKYHDDASPDGRAFRLNLMSYPKPAREDS